MTRITVIRDSIDPADGKTEVRRAWLFWLHEDLVLYLDVFTCSTRQRGNRIFQTVGRHGRLEREYDPPGNAEWIREADVEIPADVAGEAIRAVVEKLKVRKWSERK